MSVKNPRISLRKLGPIGPRSTTGRAVRRKTIRPKWIENKGNSLLVDHLRSNLSKNGREFESMPRQTANDNHAIITMIGTDHEILIGCH